MPDLIEMPNPEFKTLLIDALAGLCVAKGKAVNSNEIATYLNKQYNSDTAKLVRRISGMLTSIYQRKADANLQRVRNETTSNGLGGTYSFLYAAPEQQ